MLYSAKRATGRVLVIDEAYTMFPGKPGESVDKFNKVC